MNIRWLLAWGLLLAAVFDGSAQIAETYTLTDIAGWSSNQLAALPWFAHWMPRAASGAPPNLSPVAHNGAGAVVGEAASCHPAPGGDAVAENGVTTYIPAWGEHYWSYWAHDPDNCRFHWGWVEHSPTTDVNAWAWCPAKCLVPSPTTPIPPVCNPHDSCGCACRLPRLTAGAVQTKTPDDRQP
jgi:hypothetical protein